MVTNPVSPITGDSSFSVVFVLGLLIFGFFAILIPVLIGRYVYKDAKARGMDAGLWTAVALLVPSFIGLIIYLVIRSNNPNRNCPSCQKPIAAEYLLCPYCGVPLKSACPGCRTPIDSGWKLCPKCGGDLPPQNGAPALAAPKKDKRLGRILIIAILVPVLLLVLGLGGLFLIRRSTTRPRWTSGVSLGLSLEDDQASLHPAVPAWVRKCDAAGKGVYVLKLNPQSHGDFIGDQMGDSQNVHFVYVYINLHKGEQEIPGYAYVPGASKENVHIKYISMDPVAGKRPDYFLTSIGTPGAASQTLVISIDGKQVDYVMTEAG